MYEHEKTLYLYVAQSILCDIYIIALCLRHRRKRTAADPPLASPASENAAPSSVGRVSEGVRVAINGGGFDKILLMCTQQDIKKSQNVLS